MSEYFESSSKKGRGEYFKSSSKKDRGMAKRSLEFRSRIALENFKRVVARRAIEQRARP